MDLIFSARSSIVLAWVPGMDGGAAFARMLYGVKGFYGFDWGVFWVMRVLVVSRMGSHSLLFELSLTFISQQFRPSVAIVAASGGFWHPFRISVSDFAGARAGCVLPCRVELAKSLRCRREAAPLF